MKTTEDWARIRERISERSGLTEASDIDAYIYFCKHSSTKDGVIMWGDVQSEIYNDLINQASSTMKVLETAYNESVGNGEEIPQRMSYRLFTSPMSKRAKEVFSKHYHKFIELDLIRLPKNGLDGWTAEHYPTLNGYNYFNDPEFTSQ